MPARRGVGAARPGLLATVLAGLVAAPAPAPALLLAARRRGGESALTLMGAAIARLGRRPAAGRAVAAGLGGSPGLPDDRHQDLGGRDAVRDRRRPARAPGGTPRGVGLRRVVLDAGLLGVTATLLLWRLALSTRALPR